MQNIALKLIFFISLFVILLNCMKVLTIKNTVETGIILLMIIITIILKRRSSNLLEFFTAPINHKLGEYGGIKLNAGDFANRRQLLVSDEKMFKNFNQKSKCNWMKAPCNTPLLKDVDIYNPTGKSKKITNDINSGSLPSVDGTKEERKKLFMFTYNQCRPECCPSTYSCDRGCVCTNEQQRKFINTRGSNRNKSNYPGI